MDSKALRGALPDRIETDRLALCAPGQGDVVAIAKLANNPKIHAMTTLPYPYGQADALEFVTKFVRSEQEHAYAITGKDGRLIGMIGLHMSASESPEIGYWLGEPFWNKGYATEAARALIDTIRETGHCSALRAKVRSENTASQAVLEKLGFTRLDETISRCGPHKDVPITIFELTIAAESF